MINKDLETLLCVSFAKQIKAHSPASFAGIGLAAVEFAQHKAFYKYTNDEWLALLGRVFGVLGNEFSFDNVPKEDENVFYDIAWNISDSIPLLVESVYKDTPRRVRKDWEFLVISLEKILGGTLLSLPGDTTDVVGRYWPELFTTLFGEILRELIDVHSNNR